VLTTVYFDDNALLETDEVENEFLKGDLPREFVLLETPVAEQSPHRGFSVGGSATHIPGELADAFGDGTMAWRLRREPLTRRLTS
jgi:hypothetical protein